ELNELLEMEEIMWHQRSRVSWLRDGDKNTKFFHSKASQRSLKNRIRGIRDDSDYFQSIFSTSQPVNMQRVLDQVHGRVTVEMNEALMTGFTRNEIEIALRQMHLTKALRPDGMPAIFF
ncbi:hypothetical protein CFOL_v3_13079, partial [Cephalotus follicularis]